MIVEKIFAAVVVVACALMLVRLSLGHRRRDALDHRMRRSLVRLHRRALHAIAYPSAHLRAGREASEAIRRAQRVAGDRDGNVVRPNAFKPKDDKRRDLH